MTIHFPAVDAAVVAPALWLVAAGLAVLLADLFANRAPRGLLYGIGLLGCVVAFVSLVPQFGHPATTLAGAFASDQFSWAFDALLIFSLAAALLLSMLRRADDGGNPG
ncbi:MAG TPA: hypothetical protein VFF43_19115, partial [Caldimonas sp.]|nr:hypothetical protein [Caldimonas sp.]